MVYDPQPPSRGIDWNQVDCQAMAPMVTGWIHDALADHPEIPARLTG